MSLETVELVRRLQPSPEVDLVEVFGDDGAARALLETFGQFFAPEFESVGRGASVVDFAATGLEGFRALWREWLTPWETYRTEVEDVVDLGDDRVLVLVRDYGRRRGMASEMHAIGGAVWTVRAGRVSRVEFFLDRAAALEAAGLRP